ncbi:MAG: ABC transporter ATP-binding protein [Deltaproteobacteria bacterium]|nr:ABC transporter ATP-binding protein [Deltaproteobacteria bacterium]
MYLCIENLNKIFYNTSVVKNFSLNIKKGELITILGPSGCGKTTTLRMLGGFLNPDSGSIILDSVDITGVPANKRPTSTVFQSYALFPHMNVMQNVIYGLKFKKIKKKEAVKKGFEMLETVGLTGFENQMISNLSGGQQQRVALARALIVSPKILLLDEPLSNLDAKLRVQMRKEIKEIQLKTKTTAIFVTHDQDEALSISDRVVVMNKGKIIQTGTPVEIYKTPEKGFVAGFIGKMNEIPFTGSNKKKMVRPENILIRTFDNKSRNTGQIIGKQFMGPYTTYFINSHDHIIEVDVSEKDNRNWKPGDQVNFEFCKEIN